MDEVSFGVWLQRRRRALDMTQADLGRRVAAERDLAASLVLAEVDDDRWMQAAICLAGALVAYHRADRERRAGLLTRSLSLARAIDDSLGIAEALLWSGNIAVGRVRSTRPSRPIARRACAMLRWATARARRVCCTSSPTWPTIAAIL